MTVVSEATGRDGWLVAVCAARVLLYGNFMTVAACLPVVRPAWEMSGAEAGSVTTGFMFGYALSLVGFAWLADRIGAKRAVVWSAVSSGATAVLFGLLARSYPAALLLYTLAALSQGGVYTPLIMLIADRYPPARRGAAMGWLIASTSVGYAASLVIAGVTLDLGGYPLAFLVTGIMPAVGALMIWLALRDTENKVHARTSRLSFGTLLRTNTEARLLIAGYTAHSWELLGMWAWIPAFLAASATLAGADLASAAVSGAYLAAALHATGALASSSMGGLSDRLGRRAVLIGLAAASACLSLTLGWLVAWPVEVLLVLGLVYSFTAIGDSPVLSTAITEVVEPGVLGAVLALRAFLGFSAGAIAPLAFGAVLDATNPAGATPETWGFAFVALGVGGVIATACAIALRPRRAT